MSLTPGIWSDNAQTPFSAAELFVPDQLIAGFKQVVSDNATISGAAVLQRGTVLGLSSFGTVVGTPGIAYATGSITVIAVPTPLDTVTIQGTVITFVATPTGYPSYPAVGNEVVIPLNATTALVASALCSFLNGSTDANLVKMNYSVSGSVVTVNSNIPGLGGNAYTLATSNSAAFTVSGSILSGGTANTGTASIGSISAGPNVHAGVYRIVLTSATQGPVIDPAGDELGVMTMGTAFTDAQINFTITTGGSPAAGDGFTIIATPTAAGIYKACVASAVDGSHVPAAILADTCDPTGGNVLAGIYISGEFNGNALIFDPSLSIAGIKAALRPQGIYIKSSVSSAPPQ